MRQNMLHFTNYIRAILQKEFSNALLYQDGSVDSGWSMTPIIASNKVKMLSAYKVLGP
jgi:hypothetical protein